MKILETRTYVGPNIHSYRTVIAMQLDLEGAAETPSTQIPGLVEELLRIAPGLQTHECSKGVPGGFVQRLREGTYMAHVAEHLALELQNAVGCQVSFGRARELSEPGRSRIVFEYEVAEVGKAAGRTAVQIINLLLEGKSLPHRQHFIEPLRQLKAEYGFGPTTAAIVEAARNREIPVIRIGDCSLVQLGWGEKQCRIQASTTGGTSCISVDIACDKWLTKQFLQEIGIPTPLARLVQNPVQASAVAEELGFPLVVKPSGGNHGNGVTVGVNSLDQLEAAYKGAIENDERVILEQQVEGNDYRLLVVGNEVVAAAQRIPAAVVGDGRHTVQELIDQVNQDPRRGEDHAFPLTKIVLDPMAIEVLAEAGLTAESVPPEGQTVFLRRTANISTGGTAVDVTDLVHPEIKAMAVRAVCTIGLDIAGVDLVCQDVSAPLRQSGAQVIEVNASPGLRMHLYPAEGQPRDVAGLIVNHLFPLGDNGRIPVIAVTGTNGKTTVTRLIRHILSLTGKTVGMTTTDGICVGEEQVCQGDTTGPWSTGIVLKDPRVQAAVLEVARGGILRSGLGFDYSDIAVITNISDDHLGQDGIQTLEDMAFVKSLVGECVRPGGHLVLNGDDPLVREMAERSDAKPIFFTMKGSDSFIRQLSGQGHTVVARKDGRIVVRMGSKETIVASVETIPITLQGMADHNIANALAAVGAVLAAGVPVELIKRGLETFGQQPEMNQGRLNLTQVNGIDVLIDYGHNPAGYQAVLETAKQIARGRLIGVVGAPGDRTDDTLVEVGRMAGRYLDTVVLKEDEDLRGRQSGQVAQLLRFGVSEQLPDASIYTILDEETAIVQAIGQASPDDLVVVFYEKLETVQRGLQLAAQENPTQVESLAFSTEGTVPRPNQPDIQVSQ